jgi:dynein heavy chain
MKEHLRELAERQARESSAGLQEIRARLKEPLSTLQAYATYVTELDACRQRKDQIADQKKRLDEMKGVLSKYKSKDEGGYGSGFAQGALQARIEGLAAEIGDVEGLLQQAEEAVKEAKEANVEELDRRVLEEQDRVAAQIDKLMTSETLMRAGTPAKVALAEAADLKKGFDKSVVKLAQLQAFQATLKLPAPAVPEVEEFERKYALRHRLWEIRQTFGEQQRRWYGENFRDQDAQAIVTTVAERSAELVKMKFALGRDTQDEVLAAATAEVRDVQRHASLIAALGNPSMQEKHWVKVWALCESPPATLLNFSFQTLLAQGIDAHLERVEEISAFAAGEAAILKTVSEIAAAWEETAFTVRGYRDTKDRFFITEIDELVTQLEDHQMTVQTSMGSKYVAEIRDEVEAWEKRLGYISDCLDEWLIFQKAWMYLENIFNAEDIVAQLPTEAKQFVQVDKFWKDTMLRTKKNPLVTDACSSEALLGRFQGNNKALEDIQKGLEDYLETKRAAFPRFYFLSNDELLEILS